MLTGRALTNEVGVLVKQLLELGKFSTDDRIGRRFERSRRGTPAGQGGDVPGELWPAFESLCSRDDELPFGERNLRMRRLSADEFLELGCDMAVTDQPGLALSVHNFSEGFEP